MLLTDGQTFAGYTVLRPLGSGGMGEVYLVQHPRLPRQDALKILPAALTRDPEFRQRFNREADLAAGLSHQHIVTIHDRGEWDGQLWISMDYVDGTDAVRLLHGRYRHGMPVDEVVEIVDAVAGALDYAHRRGLLHRDVKPANILLSDGEPGQRRILLADFGIARRLDDTSGLTATNMTVGSVAYAAPEQLTDAPLDGRADQYALAGSAFHLLTGKPPFPDSNPAVVIGRHLSATPPRPSDYQPNLAPFDDVFATAMAKEPAARFAGCLDFAAALQRTRDRALAGGATAVAATMPAPRFTTRPGTPPPPPGRSRWPVLVTAAAAAAVTLLGLVAFFAARPGQDSRGAAGPQLTPARITAAPPSVVTVTAPPVAAPPLTVTQQIPSPVVQHPIADGDLGLATPISHPGCDGIGIVVLGSVVTPGQYAQGVQRFLTGHPGASYLRTDQACPSLRQATAAGDPIYAVYRAAGYSQAEVCAAVRSAGGDSYGKWLDMGTDPGYIIPC